MPAPVMTDFQFLRDDYVICICEGTAEEVIMNILLDNNCLTFCRDNLVDGELTRIRKASKIQDTFLNREFRKPVHIIRILDSKRERFNLNILYKDRFDVYDIYTRPEIEMLIIWKENLYEEYRRRGLSPSQYVQQLYPHKRIKSRKFVEEYFSDYHELLQAIKLYHSDAGRNRESCLYHLLHVEYQR